MAFSPPPRQLVIDTNVLIASARPDIGHVPPEERTACARLMDAIGRGDLRGHTPAPTFAEVLHVLARNGVPPRVRTPLIERWSSMAGRFDIVDLTVDLAIAAGEYRQAHYHRERLPLSYIDCFCLVLAQQLGVPLVTLEEPLRRAPHIIAATPAQFLANHGL